MKAHNRVKGEGSVLLTQGWDEGMMGRWGEGRGEGGAGGGGGIDYMPMLVWV